MSMCIFARMVCASALSFLDGKICAVQQPFIITVIIILDSKALSDKAIGAKPPAGWSEV